MTTEVNASSALLIGFPDGETQAQSLAMRTGLAHAQLVLRRFPDGESYVRLPESLPDHVIFHCSMHRANDKLVELLLAARTARRNGAKRISLLAPYLCYMRQDAAFHPGEAISQTIVGELLAQHFDDLLTIDPHLHRTPLLNEAMPVRNAHTLTAARLISDFLQTSLDAEPLILGPDAESEQWAKAIAAPQGLDYAIATKTRFGDRDVNVEMPQVDVTDRIVVIIDDISSSGHTLIQAALQIKDQGARAIYAVVTHALLNEASILALHDAGIEKVWSTDTIPHRTNAIEVESVLAEAIGKYLS